jgi:hypothetical protein
VLKRHSPHGTYPPDKPLVIPFAKDGRAGDYRLVITGQQDDMTGLQMPMSTLPYEVYGRTYFAASHDNTPIYFKAPRDVQSLNIAAYTGTIRVFQGDKLIVDAQKDGKQDGRDWTVDFPVTPGETYHIDRKCVYFRSTTGLLFTFDPKTWFEPDPALDKINWWECKP